MTGAETGYLFDKRIQLMIKDYGLESIRMESTKAGARYQGHIRAGRLIFTTIKGTGMNQIEFRKEMVKNFTTPELDDEG